MSSQDPTGHGDDEQFTKKKSAEFASAMLEFADKQLGKKSKKKTPFTEQVLEQARLVRNDEDPGQRSRQSTEELWKLVRQLDDTHKKTSKTRRASEFLQPFVEGVTRYSAVVDTMVQSDPTVSALVWGGAKFVLQLAVEFSQHYENLTKLLETLGTQLGFFGALSEIFDWSEELCSILMKSYQDVLVVLEAAADAYGQSGFKTFIKGMVLPYDRKYKHFEEKLEKNMQSVRDSVSLAQSYMMRKQKEDNDKRKLNQWLFAPATDPTYKHCIEHKQPSTCGWLFADSNFQTWEKATSQSPLNERVVWIYGPPGIGKTFLASSVIERLQGKDQEVIYYFLRDEKSGSPLQPGRGEALTMLRYLARQLVDIIQYKRKHKLPTGFWDIYDKSDGTYLSDIDSAIGVVHFLLAVIPRIHIVVDGLDECINRHTAADVHRPAWKANKLLPTILERLVRSKPHGTVKWCFTSCPESDLSNLFHKLEALRLEVTPGLVREDVIKYVTNECFNNPDIGIVDDDALFLALAQCLGSANFLDARLTLELLGENGVTTREELLTSILRYKEGFNSRYLRGLSALAAKPRNEKELARRIIKFVVTAERPLTRNELLDALAVQPGSDIYSCDRRPKPEKFEELLAPLLELDRSISYSNPTVRFIHRTAREFMEQVPGDIENLPAECKDFFADEDQKNREFGKVCLTYLTRQNFGYRSTEEMEKALCNSMDEDCNSVLKYASIFWYHHLNETSPTQDLFEHIARFMRSTNFLTCLWVQSKWAPYQMARYTTEERKASYHIENPTMVFLSNPTLQMYYADPLPGWLEKFNEHGARLVQGCQLLVKEFGLVLLRRRGGIQHCHPCSLGTMNFLPPEDEVNWRALALENPGEARLDDVDCQGRQFISVNIGSSGHILTRTIIVGSDLKSSKALAIREWQVSLSRKKSKALELKKQAVLSFPPPGFLFPEIVQDMLISGFEVDSVIWSDLNIPEHIMHEHHRSTERHLTDRGRAYATNGTVRVVSYLWSTSPTYADKGVNRSDLPSKKTTSYVAVADSESDSDSDSDAGSASGSDIHDSGYFSASPPSSTTGRMEKLFWCTSIGIKDKDCHWYHFETLGTYLRQSPPVVHPTKPFVLMSVIGARTVVINYVTGEKKELHDSNKEHAVSRIHHFSHSGDKLYELVTTRDFVHGSRWTISINFLQFCVDESNDVNSVTITQSDTSSVSWISPYSTPFELPEHTELPFKVTWAERHVFFVFGACEVYVVRMLLDPPKKHVDAGSVSVRGSPSSSDDDDNKETNLASTGTPAPVWTGPPRIETTKNPAFLPASTTERPFTYVPHPRPPPPSPSVSDAANPSNKKEYAIFAIAGSKDLPPVLIRKDIDTDLGGWVSCDVSDGPQSSGMNLNSRVVGKDQEGEDEEDDMKGKYSCNALSFRVPIRSGLAWNQRVEVECGAE